MKYAIGMFAGLLAAGLVVGAAPAFADQLPQGSYRESCRDIKVIDGTLLAQCRQPDGAYWGISGLAAVESCVGGVVNRRGDLYCDRGPMFGSDLQRDEARQRRQGD